jgi:hypothetical protein
VSRRPPCSRRVSRGPARATRSTRRCSGSGRSARRHCPFEDHVVTEIVELSGGRPYYLQKLAYFAFDAAEAGRVGRAEFTAAFERAFASVSLEIFAAAGRRWRRPSASSCRSSHRRASLDYPARSRARPRASGSRRRPLDRPSAGWPPADTSTGWPMVNADVTQCATDCSAAIWSCKGWDDDAMPRRPPHLHVQGTGEPPKAFMLEPLAREVLILIEGRLERNTERASTLIAGDGPPERVGSGRPHRRLPGQGVHRPRRAMPKPPDGTHRLASPRGTRGQSSRNKG